MMWVRRGRVVVSGVDVVVGELEWVVGGVVEKVDKG